MTPANSAYTVDELYHQLTLSKTTGIITEKSALKGALEAAKRVGIPEDKVLIVEEGVSGFRCWKDILIENGDSSFEMNDPNSLAVLCFSSGTTGTRGAILGLIQGLPKAVMLSHRNIAAAVLQFADIEGRYLTHRDVFAGVLPFYHIGYDDREYN